MDKSALQQRLHQIDAKFAETKVKRDQQEAELQNSDTELHRIQGEYRMVQELISELELDGAKAKEERPRRALGEDYPTDGPSEGEITEDNTKPFKRKLNPIDETGIPDEGKWTQGGRHNGR